MERLVIICVLHIMVLCVVFQATISNSFQHQQGLRVYFGETLFRILSIKKESSLNLILIWDERDKTLLLISRDCFIHVYYHIFQDTFILTYIHFDV